MPRSWYVFKMLLCLSKIYHNFSLLPLILPSFSLIVFSYLYHVSVMPYFSPFSSLFFSLPLYHHISLWICVTPHLASKEIQKKAFRKKEESSPHTRVCLKCTSTAWLWLRLTLFTSPHVYVTLSASESKWVSRKRRRSGVERRGESCPSSWYHLICIKVHLLFTCLCNKFQNDFFQLHF